MSKNETPTTNSQWYWLLVNAQRHANVCDTFTPYTK